MSFREIEKILERYFNGETSLSEERELKEFFLKENIPDHLKVLKDQFVYFHEAEKVT